MPTADLGKMGRLYIELRKSLMTTHMRFYEEMGFDWEDEIDQAARELSVLLKKEQEYNLPPGSLSAWLTNQSPLPAATPPEGDEAPPRPPA